MKNIFKLITFVSLSFVMVSANATLIFSQDGNSNGLYSIDVNTAVATHLGISGVTSSTVGLSPSANPNILYGSSFTQLLHINADGSGATAVGTVNAEGLAFDSATSTLYGQLNNSFFTIDVNTGVHLTTLASAPGDPDGLTFGNGGVYGIADSTNALIFYNVGLNSWSTIGSLGISINNPGLAYDPLMNTLYTMGTAGNLYSVNTGTGQATLIGNTGLNGAGGLAFVSSVPEPTTLALLGLGLFGLGFNRRKRLY